MVRAGYFHQAVLGELPLMHRTRVSILTALIVNAWTMYAAVYYALFFMGATTVAGPLALLAGMAALLEPVLTYLATGRI